MRQALHVLLTVLLIGFLIVPATAKAAEYDQNKGVFGEQMENYLNTPFLDEPDQLEKSLSKMLISPANWMLNAFGMQDPTILVFGKNPAPPGKMADVYEKGSLLECSKYWFLPGRPLFPTYSECREAKKTGEVLDDFLQGDCVGKTDCREGLALGVLNDGMMSAVDVLYSVFEVFVPFPVVIGLMFIGIWIIWKSMSSSGRTETKEYISAFVVGLLSLRYGYYLWALVAYVVDKFTAIIWASLQMIGVKQNLMLYMIWGNGRDGYGTLASMRGLAIALIIVAATIMTFLLNYQYIMRAIMLMVLLVMFPVCCTLTIFPKFRHSLQTWWDEFLVNMILPVGHALALGLFFLLLYYSTTGISVWVIIAYFFGLPTIAALVRKLIIPDYAGGVKGGASAMLGIAGMMSIKKMMTPKGSRGTASDSSPAGSSSTNEEGIGGASPAGSGAGVFSGSGRSGIGKIAGFGLKAAGAAGMVAVATSGFVVGTMAGNSAAGLAGGVLAGRGMKQMGGVFMKTTNGALAKGGAWINPKRSQSLQAAPPVGMSSAAAGTGSQMVSSSPNPPTTFGPSSAPSAANSSSASGHSSSATPSLGDGENDEPVDLVRSEDEEGNEIWAPDYRPKPGDPKYYDYDV